MQIAIPVSLGELLDKMTILEIKVERIADPQKCANVTAELEGLRMAYSAMGDLDAERRSSLEPLFRALKEINYRLWEIEDDLRICERNREFDARFIELARAVYKENDERARIKREINVTFGSRLIEEKSYA